MRVIAVDLPQGIRFSDVVSFGGDVSKRLHAILEEAAAHLRIPSFAYGAQSQMNGEIERIAAECGFDDWDGDGSPAIMQETAAIARDVIEALPPGLPAPDVEGGSHGEIMFEWRPAPRRLLILSVYPDNTIGHAVVRGLARASGRQPFNGVITGPLLAHFRSILEG